MLERAQNFSLDENIAEIRLYSMVETVRSVHCRPLSVFLKSICAFVPQNDQHMRY